MKTFKTMSVLFTLIALFSLQSCQDPDAKINMTNTRWYFVGYTNSDAIQNQHPQPRDEREYRQQNNCLAGNIEFRQNDPATGGNPMVIQDQCGRPTSQQAIYDAYAQKRIEYILNNATGNQRDAWDFTQDGKKLYFIRQMYSPNVTTYILFDVYYQNNGNEMIWRDSDGRTIGWSRTPQHQIP